MASDPIAGAESRQANHIAQTMQRIQQVINVDHTLGRYAEQLKVSIDDAVIVLRGRLPSDDLRRQLLPTIRRAGVLWQIQNQVDVRG